MSVRHGRAGNARQRGVALVIGLIFLVLVSLIATVGMRQSITQERMAGGLRNDSLARAGAETALRAGERLIFDHYLTSNGSALVGDPGAINGVYSPDGGQARAFVDADPTSFVTAGATPVPADLVAYSALADYSSRLAEQPVFVIEDMGPAQTGGLRSSNRDSSDSTAGLPQRVYRVTARSVGGSPTVVRTLQSTYTGPARP